MSTSHRRTSSFPARPDGRLTNVVGPPSPQEAYQAPLLDLLADQLTPEQLARAAALDPESLIAFATGASPFSLRRRRAVPPPLRRASAPLYRDRDELCPYRRS
ncbi:MAG: hypothetical protein V4850_16260 [Myxococcota bacterium]